jgi:hypothetical protein
MFCKCYGLDLCHLMRDSKFCTCLHSAQIKEAILNGVSLEDDKREQFNKIQQVCFKATLSF